MTCKELHNRWKSDVLAGIDLGLGLVEFEEHVASCPKCNRFVEEHRELTKHLHAVRESAPAISALFDEAVLDRYRSYLSGRSQWSRPIFAAPRIYARRTLGWVAAVAFAAVVVYGGMLVFTLRQPVRVDREVNERTMVAGLPVHENHVTTAARKLTRQRRTSHGIPLQREDSFLLPNQDNSIPSRFQSLMYCDPIICPDTMDVIRVQLSAAVWGLTSASAPINSTVYADVLVGPDGIARGIRVVE